MKPGALAARGDRIKRKTRHGDAVREANVVMGSAV